MLNEKNLYDYHLKNDYSDFQFISSWEKLQILDKSKIFPIKLIKYEDLNNKTFEILRDTVQFIQSISGEKKDLIF